MRNWILKNFNTNDQKIKVLYDRPSDKYRIASEKERNNVQIITHIIYNLCFSIVASSLIN